MLSTFPKKRKKYQPASLEALPGMDNNIYSKKKPNIIGEKYMIS
ncbi:Uncharacterised protein [Escherichia coli]|nr:Uncharacterised protein [Escherichia coli]